MDFKKKYIIRCVLSLLALEEEPQELTESDKLQELIDANSINSLLILYKPGKSNQHLKFRTKGYISLGKFSP